MIKILILLSAILIGSAASPTLAQESNQTPKPAPPAASQSEKPKNEVDQQLEESKKKGVLVLATCLEDCGEGITGDVETGHAIDLPKPDYPAIARMAHASGQVLVQVIIDEDGKVIAAAAVSGHPLLYGVSVAAARQARFSTTKYKGEPVKVTGVISFNFVAK